MPTQQKSKSSPKAKGPAKKDKAPKKLEKKKPAPEARVAKAAKGSDAAEAVETKRPPAPVTQAHADDIDPEEAAEELAAAIEVDPDAVEDETEEEAVVERKEVKDLLETGRQKGYLTYDEVNDALPADIVSSDQIDDVMSMFGDNDIEIVDAQKAAQTTEVKPTVAASEEAQKEIEEEEKEEEDEPGGKSNDPVRLYLRKMGSVSLLTREGEVEIAKRIEEGEKEVLRAMLACRLAVAEILDMGNKLRAGKLRVREVVKDAPEEAGGESAEEATEEVATDGESGQLALAQSELNRIEQICKQIEKFRKIAKEVDA